MIIPNHIKLSYNTESKEIADITERAINELPIEIISPDKAKLVITGFHNPDKTIKSPLERHKLGKSLQERFATPYEGSSEIYSQINLVSGKVQYTDPDDVDFKKYMLGKSRRQRYEVGASIFLDPIIQPPFLMMLDKELKTELVIYLSHDGSKNLKEHLKGYLRFHKNLANTKNLLNKIAQ